MVTGTRKIIAFLLLTFCLLLLFMIAFYRRKKEPGLFFDPFGLKSDKLLILNNPGISPCRSSFIAVPLVSLTLMLKLQRRHMAMDGRHNAVVRKIV